MNTTERDNIVIKEIEKQHGELICFWPTAHGKVWTVSVIVYGESGHYPLESLYYGTENGMKQKAHELNGMIGMPEETVLRYVTQSMFPKKGK